MRTRQIVFGMVVLAVSAAVTGPAHAQVLQRNRPNGERVDDGARRPRESHRSQRSHERRFERGPYLDGSWILGAVGLGILLDALIDAAPPPDVVYEDPRVRVRHYGPEEFYRRSGPEEPYQPYDPSEYPPPQRYYPECKEFVGNPGAMAFCEKGVLERENEEQRRLEQKAYETGRGK